MIYGILYSLGALLTGLSFWYINIKYFGKLPKLNALLYTTSLLMGVLWPIGLPISAWQYRDVIRSLLKGRDWVDMADVSDEIKNLVRMSDEDAALYLENLEEEYVRQIKGRARGEAQASVITDNSLN